MHKIFKFLASKVHLSPSGNVYIVPDKWSVYAECLEDEKVKDDSGHFIKGTWNFMMDLNHPFMFWIRKDPSAEIFSQCYNEEKPRASVQIVISFTLWSGQKGSHG